MRPALATILLAAAVLSCSPAKPTRIGPAVVPRPADCELEVMEEGERPTRPYREVGMITLENCQDYRTPPCSGWLQEAACGLGGTIVYPTDDGLVRADPAYVSAGGPRHRAHRAAHDGEGDGGGLRGRPDLRAGSHDGVAHLLPPVRARRAVREQRVRGRGASRATSPRRRPTRPLHSGVRSRLCEDF